MVEEHSNEWVAGVIDWEGWPDCLEHIEADEIEDKDLGNLWYEAQQEYALLENLHDRIRKIIDYERLSSLIA